MENTASEIIKRLRRLSLPSQLVTRGLDQELVRVDLERLLAERKGAASAHEAALQQIAQLTAELKSLQSELDDLEIENVNLRICLERRNADPDEALAALSAPPQEK